MMDPLQPPSQHQSILERLEKAEQCKMECRHVEALEILEEVLVEDPVNVAALEEVADNELSLERFERAKTAATRAVALDPASYTGLYILGYLHTQDGSWEPAVDLLQRANKLKPNDAELLRCLGWALFHNGKRPQGIVTLERSLNLESDSTLTLCDLGVVYLELKNFAKSKALFQRVLDLDPQNVRARECVAAVERLEKATVGVAATSALTE